MAEFILGKDELKTIVDEIIKMLPDGGVVVLSGNLAAGKTTLVKEAAKYFCVDEESVSSPTFCIMNRYGDGFYHYDIYNDGAKGLLENGLFENLGESGYHFVEWGDKKLISLLKIYGFSYIIVEIETYEDKRLYKVRDA